MKTLKVFLLFVMFDASITFANDNNTNISTTDSCDGSVCRSVKTFFHNYIVPEVNPAFGDNKHQVGLYYGISTGVGSAVYQPDKASLFQENLNLINLMYGQPTKFLNFNGRMMMDMYIIAGDGNAAQFNNIAGGLTQEVIFGSDALYITAGVGFSYRSNKGDRVNSFVTAVLVNAIGRRFGNFNVELMFKHFSNGGLQLPNVGENFVGISLRYNIKDIFGW